MPETDHIEFVNPDLPYGGPQPRGFPGYSPTSVYRLTALPEGDYGLKFSVPKNAAPGKYYFEYFNRSDVFSNFEDIVGNVDEQEKSLSKLHPLIIK